MKIEITSNAAAKIIKKMLMGELNWDWVLRKKPIIMHTIKQPSANNSLGEEPIANTFFRHFNN